MDYTADADVDIDADHYPVAKQPQSQAQSQPQQQPQSTTPIKTEPATKPGIYKTITPAEENRFTPSNDLPSQYQSGSVQKWLCGSCGMENGLTAMKCGMCGNEKAALVSTVSYEKAPSGSWKCPRCTVENKADSLTCSMCGTRWEPVRVVTNAPKAASVTSTGAASKKSPGGKPKKKIVGKNESGVELEYAKKVDVHVYKAGSKSIPGHGASM